MNTESVRQPFASIGAGVATLLGFLLGRNRPGALLRLILLISSFGLYWITLVFSAGFPGEIPLAWEAKLGTLVYFLFNLLAPFFHPSVLIHLIPVVFGLAAGLFLAALLLSDLFELESFWIALHYLLGAMFGLSYPVLRVNRGDAGILETENADNPIVRIGGPGYLRVYLGFAAVTERENGIPLVYGPPGENQEPSSTFLDGFERLRNVIDLRDQLGVVQEVRAITRDGIEVYARDAQMLFRVYGGGKARSLQAPFPYTEESLRRLTYGQPVENKRRNRWEDFLPSVIRSEIRDFVAKHTLEQFLALQPYRILDDDGGGADVEREREAARIHIPRRQLSEHFHTADVQGRLQELGLELDWVGVGTWELRDDPAKRDLERAGPGKTLVATWRDLQRATLYASPDYQARQRKRRYNETLSQVLSRWISAWKHSDYTGVYRCFGMLQTLYETFGELLALLQNDPSAHIPPDVGAVLSHLGELRRPRELGGSDAFGATD